jgi:uncharacterized small protein (DUF1192 family)
MTRVTVRIPKTTLDQINDWVDTLGVRRSHFLGIALVAGVRSLIRASALELALAAETDFEKAREPESAQDAATKESLVDIVDTLRAEVTVLKAEIANLKASSEHKKHS